MHARATARLFVERWSATQARARHGSREALTWPLRAQRQRAARGPREARGERTMGPGRRGR
eukprot:5202821-Pyramimonas_sp.AAC.1